MTKILIAAAAAALVASAIPAQADYQSRTTCGRTYLGKYECTSSFGRQTLRSGPVELRTNAEIQEEEDRWVAYCKPRRGPPDQYGVVRMLYAHPGCEFGAVR